MDALRVMTDILDSSISDMGGEINVQKTEWLESPPDPEADLILPLTIRGELVKKCPNFCYLGSVIGNDRSYGSVEDLSCRIKKARRMFAFLSRFGAP